MPGKTAEQKAVAGPAEDALARGESLLSQAVQCCAHQVALHELCQIADRFKEILLQATPDVFLALAGYCHEFIDLAVRSDVRQAAYPPRPGTEGGRWINAVVDLIRQSDLTVGALFRRRAAAHGNRTLFVVPQAASVHEYTWSQVGDRSERIARGIFSVAGGIGESVRVALFTPNCMEGALVDLACLTNGIFNVAIPANATPDQLEQILRQSGANMLFASSRENVAAAVAVADAVPALRWIVSLQGETPSHEAGLQLAQIVAAANGLPADALLEHRAQVHSNDIATAMFTSGTTGAPKGIQFSHLNLVSKRYARAAALPEIGPHDTFVCFLPLYHTFGRWLEMLGCVHLGATYVFAGDVATATLLEHMQRFRPTALISVPKKWIDIQERVNAEGSAPHDPDQVRQRLHHLTGGRLRWGLSAAGRLDPDIFRFFQANGVDLLSGYGMTEATGGITMTQPGQYKEDTIGKPLPCIEVQLGPDGELMLRGPYVSPGYVDPADTEAAYRDGWFCTGDIVEQDEEGYLKHVDRKKDIYKNARGRTIAPQRIESLFDDFPEVARVFAIGDGREYVTLLIRPDEQCQELNFGEMSAEARREYFRGLVCSCNKFLAPFERVVRFALIDRDFREDLEELTPKGSFRRRNVEESFRSVIDSMYESTYIARTIGHLEVRIPITFLQHLGGTAEGVIAMEDGIHFRATGKTLRVRSDEHFDKRVWIGNCRYRPVGRIVELDKWFRAPELWIGNAELVDLTGQAIASWALQTAAFDQRLHIDRIDPPRLPNHQHHQDLELIAGQTPTLMGMHAAVNVLIDSAAEDGLRAVEYLAHALRSGPPRRIELASNCLRRAALHTDRNVRSRAFVELLEHEPAARFGETVSRFFESLNPFVDESTSRRMAGMAVPADRWNILSTALAGVRSQMVARPSAEADAFVIDLIHWLVEITRRQWSYYAAIQRELACWQLAPVSSAVQARAAEADRRLTAEFRASLGRKHDRAVDLTTGDEYTWGDVLQFEDGIDPEEIGKIAGAIQHTELVREAVYLGHNGLLIDLEDVVSHGVWISPVGARFGRSVYRVLIQLRSGERCGFIIYVRRAARLETFMTAMQLMRVASTQPGEARLAAQFSGYWPEYDLASAELVRGEPVNSFMSHMLEHPENEVRLRIKDSWKHIFWSALTAAFEFYRRTEGAWTLAGGMARDITVPLHDFDENTRILAVAGWQPFESELRFLLRLEHEFVMRIGFAYPTLAAYCRREMILWAALESLGPADGLAFLQRALEQAGAMKSPSEHMLTLRGDLADFIERTQRDGYTPHAVYFAIRRYHAWSKQVPNATVEARAAQIRQLQASYRIDATERKFPGSRLRLYAGTVLSKLSEAERLLIDHAARELAGGAESKEVLARLNAGLLRSTDSPDVAYFLARAAYPHVEVSEKAQLVTIHETGPDKVALVTEHVTPDSRLLHIRPTASTREVDALHRIFHTGGIGGGITVEDQFLVALNERSYVIAGLSFIRRTASSVLLDKIAVLQRFRGQKVGRILLEEFLRRLQAEGITEVAAQYIRRDWLSTFGFASHPNYGGLVLFLKQQTSPPPDRSHGM
jgi:long-subunit acyl-CoA synthetase (AMP-forming)/GNAT superfamily N-acetyltransferase